MLLTQGLTVVGSPTVSISDLTGTITANPPTVTLFLYEVDEDDSVRNLPPTRRPVGGQIEIEPPPVTLRLRYLITVWTDDAASGHAVLGRIIQLFSDSAVVGPARLGGTIRDAGDALKLKLEPLTVENRSRVWDAIDKPYRLSVTYEVRGVRIDSERQAGVAPVSERRLDVATPVAEGEGGR